MCTGSSAGASPNRPNVAVVLPCLAFHQPAVTVFIILRVNFLIPIITSPSSQFLWLSSASTSSFRLATCLVTLNIGIQNIFRFFSDYYFQVEKFKHVGNLGFKQIGATLIPGFADLYFPRYVTPSPLGPPQPSSTKAMLSQHQQLRPPTKNNTGPARPDQRHCHQKFEQIENSIHHHQNKQWTPVWIIKKDGQTFVTRIKDCLSESRSPGRERRNRTNKYKLNIQFIMVRSDHDNQQDCDDHQFHPWQSNPRLAKGKV